MKKWLKIGAVAIGVLLFAGLVGYCVQALVEAREALQVASPWESVSSGTARLKVPGGWIYRTEGSALFEEPETIFVKEEQR